MFLNIWDFIIGREGGGIPIDASTPVTENALDVSKNACHSKQARYLQQKLFSSIEIELVFF